MRILLSIMIWVSFIGGLWVYMNLRENPAPPVLLQVVTSLDEGNYTLVITPTFALESDPFALNIDDQTSQNLVLRINSHPLTVDTTAFKPNQPYQIQEAPHLVEGLNEVAVQASPSVESGKAHALRIEVFQENNPIAETTIWSRDGAIVSGTLQFTLSHEEHDHANN